MVSCNAARSRPVRAYTLMSPSRETVTRALFKYLRRQAALRATTVRESPRVKNFVARGIYYPSIANV